MRPIAEQITAAIQTTEDAAKAADGQDDRVRRIVDQLDLSDWDTLAEAAAGTLGAMAADGGRTALRQIGVSDRDIVDQVNEAALAWSKERAAELVGMRYTEDGDLVVNPDARWAITASTRDMLRSDVATAIEEGLSTDDLADALESRYAFSADRAQTIARTEIARADVEGNMTAYRASGVVSGKEWVLGSEHNGEDECDDAAAMGVVPLEDDFGGIGDPPAHPGCVCDILPVLASDDAEDDEE